MSFRARRQPVVGRVQRSTFEALAAKWERLATVVLAREVLPNDVALACHLEDSAAVRVEDHDVVASDGLNHPSSAREKRGSFGTAILPGERPRTEVVLRDPRPPAMAAVVEHE